MTVLYLCGAGNPEGVRLARKIDAQARRWERIVLLDDDATKHGRTILGVEVAGGFELLARAPADAEVQNLVARTTRGRRAARERIQAHGRAFAGLVHPCVDVDGVRVASDVVVYEHAVLGAEAELGQGSVVFMGAVVGHDARVNEGCVVASNAVLNARVVLEEGVYVGTNATILPEVRIGAWATIGAGAVVVEDVPAGATVFSPGVEIVTPGADRWSTRGGSGLPRAVEPAEELTPAIDLSALEEQVEAAWIAVLGRAVGREERFFDVGGTSLLALQLLGRLRASTGVPITLTDLYRFVTVRSTAEHLARGRRGADPAPPVRPERRVAPWRKAR